MDVFVEQVVWPARRGLREALFYAAWALLIALGLLGLMSLMNILYTDAGGAMGLNYVALIQAVVCLGVAFLLWRGARRLRTEYDYTFTNGVVDVARVLNGRKRVYLTSFETVSLFAAGEEGSNAYKACAREANVREHHWYLNKDAKKYFFFYEKKGERHLVVLELNEEMVEAIFNRRFMPAAAWDGAYKNI